MASKVHRWFAKQFDEAFAFPESKRSRIRVEGSNAQRAASPTRPDCFGESQNPRPKAPSLISFTEQQEANESYVGVGITAHHLETPYRLGLVNDFIDVLIRMIFT